MAVPVVGWIAGGLGLLSGVAAWIAWKCQCRDSKISKLAGQLKSHRDAECKKYCNSQLEKEFKTAIGKAEEAIGQTVGEYGKLKTALADLVVACVFLEAICSVVERRMAHRRETSRTGD